MSEEKLLSASLESGSGESPEKDEGFGDVAEEDGKPELEDGKPELDDVDANESAEADRVGDAPTESPKEDDEDGRQEEEEGSEEGEGVKEEEGLAEEEGEEGVQAEEEEEKAQDEEEGVEEEEKRIPERREEGSEEEEALIAEDEADAQEQSSSSLLIVSSLLQEILEAVFMRAEGGDGLQAEEDEEWEEDEVGREPTEISAAESVSLTTIKSAGTPSSQLSEERRVLRQAEEEQLKREREAESQQRRFNENVRLFNQLVRERGELKRKNAYLTRKMYEFYKLHKIEHLFKELPSGNQEMEARYVRSLSKYDELKNSADIEEGKVNALIELLTTRHEEVAAVMQEELASLAAREREVGDGLVFHLTSKILQDKALDKVIHQQLAKCAEVDEFRVKFFILRDAVSAEESQLKNKDKAITKSDRRTVTEINLQALEDIGESCTMKEYEQLRLRNQACTEKLEEKDSELEKLRTKALSAMQIFTEVREAAHATEEDIESEKRTLTDVERALAETRERLGCEKKRRDLNRFDTVRLQREAGMISQPKLLRDYRRSKIQLDTLQQNAALLRDKLARQKRVLTSMRGMVQS